MNFFRSGVAEELKGAVHAVALGTLTVMACYNLGAFLMRREPHLALNVVLYGAGAWYEVGQVRRHRERCGA